MLRAALLSISAVFAGAAMAQNQPVLSVLDVKAEGAALVGQRIQVKGVVSIFADDARIRDRLGSANWILISQVALDKEKRRALWSNCERSCQAVVEGVMTETPIGAVLLASDVSFPAK